MDKRKIDEPPLCVDLDGTVIKTDTLYESVLRLIKTAPHLSLLLPFWLLKGKAHFKERVAKHIDLDATLLPYNEPFLAYLREQRELGRALVLATATNEKFAHKIASHLGIFDGVLASNESENLSGPNKLARLQLEFGDKGFDYAGNSTADLRIFPHARRAVLVNAARRLKAAAEKCSKVERVFEREPATLVAYVRLIRLHQWSKNILVFLPLFLGHKIGDPRLLVQAAMAFTAFGLCASGTYVLNDLLDLQSDREHPRKRRRPLADGAIPLQIGLLVVPLLMLGGFGFALLLPGNFIGVLALYIGSTTLYSLAIKRMAILDVMFLAGLYTLRIIGGAEAVQVVPSFWLLAFSIFFFLSLAMVKRYTEMTSSEQKPGMYVAGRGYAAEDKGILESLGSSSGYTAILVLALYIDSDDVRSQYTNPEAIWLVCPVVLYWISRVWLKAKRGEMHDDPVIFALKDPWSLWMGGLLLLILLYAL